MSFWSGEVLKLQTQGGPAWDEYCRLVADCDISMFDSPAHRALGEFQKAWERDPAGLTAALEAEAAEPKVEV